jgi:hypothetical protein
MKALSTAILAVPVTVCAATAADAPQPTPEIAALPPWTMTVASEVRYFAWKSDRGFPPAIASAGVRGRGSELYIPFAAQLAGQLNDQFRIEILGRGGWVRARQSTFGLAGKVETATDTVASSTVTYLGLNGIQPFVSINTNLPTGKSALFGSQANVRMDPDLVDIANFGEGFNLGPTAGFNLPLTSHVIATASVGYTNRGAFTREKALTPTDPTVQAPTEIDPGNVTTFTTSIGWQVNQLAGSIIGSLSTETDTAVAGVRVFRPGKRYLVSGTFSYTWPETYGLTTLTASAAQTRKNKVLFLDMATLAPVTFDAEPFNSNSNLYRIGLEHLFPLGQLWLGPTGSYLHRDHNGYDSNTLQFVPAKDRWAAGAVARYAVSTTATLNARLEHVWTHQRDNSGDAKTSLLLVPPSVLPISGVPPISSTGWQVAFGANIQF